ncbi:MAG TPA: aspartyl protease family protein [Candidatus Acidoferrales bacterium]|nr:aspartyl protease family protein [Candidatus Acidoferrales bacterium]
MKRAAAALAATAALVSFASPAAAEDATAAALFASGNFDAAAVRYSADLATNAHDPKASLGLGTIRLYQNDLAAARPLLQAALAADPSNATAASRLRELQRRVAEASRTATVAGAQTIVPFVTADPLPVVRIRVNGKDATFMIDTGGDFVLEPQFAATLGLTLEGAGTGVFAGGKTAALQRATVRRVEFGTAVAEDVAATVLPTHASDLFAGKIAIDGILGTTVFERFLVTIDYPHARLIVRPRSPAVSTAFERAATAAGATIVPCWLVGDHFVFATAQVNDAPPGLFFFDTGLAGGGLSPAPQLLTAAKITIDAARAGTGVGGGGAVTAIPFVASRIAVGNAVVRHVPGLYTPQGNPFGIFPFAVWGLISNDFLAHFAYTVDFDAMKIVLAPSV